MYNMENIINNIVLTLLIKVTDVSQTYGGDNFVMYTDVELL